MLFLVGSVAIHRWDPREQVMLKEERPRASFAFRSVPSTNQTACHEGCRGLVYAKPPYRRGPFRWPYGVFPEHRTRLSQRLDVRVSCRYVASKDGLSHHQFRTTR